MCYTWREEKRQKVWLWVGVLFFGFYFTEALLFWGPEPRVVAPPFTPLVFWGLFGAAIIAVVTRGSPADAPSSRPERIQATVLGLAITAACVGSAFLIMRRTGDVTLGHAVLLFALAQAGVTIGATSYNVGWLAAGLAWCGGGIGVLFLPAVQDYIVGAATALGFMLIGTLRKCLVGPGVGT
jgi:hypothetical protein